MAEATTDHEAEVDRRLHRLGGLVDPVRRALYRFVAAAGALVSRDEAASAVDVSRSLAAYHLDRLADDGLLEVRYERRTGRSGPGAGRPAKLYRRAPGEITVSVPARDYELAARVLAAAVDGGEDDEVRSRVTSVAKATGRTMGGQVRAGERSLVAALDEHGYEPVVEEGGDVRLRNCPFHLLAEEHRGLVCGMNVAMLGGLCAGSGFRATLDPEPGWCCVRLRPTGSKTKNS
jgi:predicted ArsR family transcriptional regulator